MIVPYYNIRKEFERIEKSFVKSIRKIGHSGNFILGQNTINFEKELQKFIGSNNIIAVANGTDALELSIAALNIPAGSEIISVSNTFVSTINAILRNECKPVLCDIDETYNIDPLKIEKLITKKTKAIIVVHLNGMPCCMSKINFIAKKYNLKVIEDSAQSILTEYGNKKIGNSKNLNCFSLHPTKNLGGLMDGGFISTNNKKLWLKCWSLKDHGKNYHSYFFKNHKTGFKWLHDDLGSNYRMTEMQALLGREQLKSLNKQIKKRNKIVNIYLNELKNYYQKNDILKKPYFKCQTCPLKQKEKSCKQCVHAFYRLSLLINKNKINQIRLIEQLNNNKIKCGVGACPEIYREKIFKKFKFYPKKDWKMQNYLEKQV